MWKIKDVINKIEQIAPLYTQLDFDTSGYVVKLDRVLKGIVICLDVDFDTIIYAKENGANLIISHHPLNFNIKRKGIKRNQYIYEKELIRLARKSNICIYASHTPFDLSEEGLLTTLSKHFASINNKKFCENCGLICSLEKGRDIFTELVLKFGNKTRVYRLHKEIKTFAYINGAGGRDENIVDELIANKVDLYITSEIKHSLLLKLLKSNISVVEPTHYSMEREFCDIMSAYLKEYFPTICIEIYDNIVLE